MSDTQRSSTATADTCFIERSKVREILIRSDADNESTRAVLQEVDALPIFTAGDFLSPAQPSLTDDQQRALERMAGHDQRDPGLSYDGLELLVQSAAQAAKDVLSASACAQLQPQWQPIGTAPKDGSYVDLWFDKDEFGPSAARDDLIYGRIPDCLWLGNETTPGWYAEHTEHGPYYIGDGATHWMRRPASPALPSTDGK